MGGEHSYDGPGVTVTIANPPAGVTPSCSPNPVPPEGSCTLTLAAWPNATTGTFQLQVDGDNGTAVRSTSLALTVYPAPAVEVLLDRSDLGALAPGENTTVNASVTFTGPPGSVANLSVTHPSNDFLDVVVVPPALAASGTATVTISVEGNATNRTLFLSVVATVAGASSSAQLDLTIAVPGPTGGNGGGNETNSTGSGGDRGGSGGLLETLPPWGLPLIVVGLIAGGAGLLVAARRRRRLPLAATGEPTREAYLIEDVFLLYKDGRVLFSRTGLGGDDAPDAELVGSMLVAIQDFVRDSFSKGTPVDQMSYGENAVLLERGSHVILAVTIFGKPGEDLRELMRGAVGAVEAQYAGVIEDWDGNRTAFAGAEDVLRPLWEPTAGLTRAEVTRALTATEVQVLSGVEFFQGFVRLKVAVQNNTAGAVDNVSVAVDHNADVLRLDRVDPGGLRRTDSKGLLGTVRPGDRSTLAFYFDPQICTSSALEGVCQFTTADGRQQEVLMKPRRADVVCPLFFTPGQANTATLRRLVEEELREYDVRAFALPSLASDQDLHEMFEALKAAVSAHDVLEVRAHESWRPYAGQAWYYGKTQKGHEMVIRASVDEEAGSAEFYAAAKSMRAVTGLLAELSHTLRSNFQKAGAGPPVVPIHNPDLRAAYRDPQLVSRMIESELEAGETST